MNTWKFEVTLQVDDTWVADGFDMSDKHIAAIADAIVNTVHGGYGYAHEATAAIKVRKSPDHATIKELQGY